MVLPYLNSYNFYEIISEISEFFLKEKKPHTVSRCRKTSDLHTDIIMSSRFVFYFFPNNSIHLTCFTECYSLGICTAVLKPQDLTPEWLQSFGAQHILYEVTIAVSHGHHFTSTCAEFYLPLYCSKSKGFCPILYSCLSSLLTQTA